MRSNTFIKKSSAIIIASLFAPLVMANTLWVPDELPWLNVTIEDSTTDPSIRPLKDSEKALIVQGIKQFADIVSPNQSPKVPVNIVVTPVVNRDVNMFTDIELLSNDQFIENFTGTHSTPKPSHFTVYNYDKFGWNSEPSTAFLRASGMVPHGSAIFFHELLHCALGTMSPTHIEVIDGEDRMITVLPEGKTPKYLEGLHDMYGRKATELIRVDDNGVRYIAFDLNLTEDHKEGLFQIRCDLTQGYGSYGGAYWLIEGGAVDEVLNGAIISWPTNVDAPPVSGIPLVGWELGADSQPYIDLNHMELRNSLFSHQQFRNWETLMEAELAAMQDVGWEFDRKRFFGHSIYNSGTADNPYVFVNQQGFWARDPNGKDWLVGTPSTQRNGIGLHVYGDHVHATQAADIRADGYGGIGIRDDGVGNHLTIKEGTKVTANGTLGIGVALTYGKDHEVVIEKGSTIEALGDGGRALSFDFGGNLLSDGRMVLGSWITATADYVDYANGDYTLDPTRWYNNFVYGYKPNEDELVYHLVMPDVKGSLAKTVTINGAIAGKEAAIYIGRTAHVGQIDINSTATVRGDIVSEWAIHNGGYTGILVQAPPRDMQDLSTHLRFNAGNGTHVYQDNIYGRESLRLEVVGGSLDFSGKAEVLSVDIAKGTTLRGGADYLLGSVYSATIYGPNHTIHNQLENNGDFLNHGTFIAEDSTIQGHYKQDGKLVLSVNRLNRTPGVNALVVKGNVTVDTNASFAITPMNGWLPSGKFNANDWLGVEAIVADNGTIHIPSGSATVSSVDRSQNGSQSGLQWWLDENRVSPTLQVALNGEQTTLTIDRNTNAYLRGHTGVSQILAQSAQHLTQTDSMRLFAWLDWSDADGRAIEATTQALGATDDGEAVRQGFQIARVVSQHMRANQPFGPQPSDGRLLWGQVFGGPVHGMTADLKLAGGAVGANETRGNVTTSTALAAWHATGERDSGESKRNDGVLVALSVTQHPSSERYLKTVGELQFGFSEDRWSQSLEIGNRPLKTDSEEDVWLFGARLATGPVITLPGGWWLEPTVGLEARAHYLTNFNENGLGGLSREVESDWFKSLELQAGISFGQTKDTLSWQGGVTIGHECLDDAGKKTMSFKSADLQGHWQETVDWDSQTRVRAHWSAAYELKNDVSLNIGLMAERATHQSHAVTGEAKLEWQF